MSISGSRSRRGRSSHTIAARERAQIAPRSHRSGPAPLAATRGAPLGRKSRFDERATNEPPPGIVDVSMSKVALVVPDPSSDPNASWADS